MKQMGLLLLLVAGCVRPEPPALPKLVSVSSTVQRGPAVLDKERLTAIYVVPRGGDEPVRVHPEDSSLPFIEMVSVMDVDGELYVNDVLHDDAPKAFGYQKIPRAQIAVQATQGTVSRRSRRYTPHRDVRLALDSGHRFTVDVLGQRSVLVLAPRYDAKDYSPLRGEGEAGATGRSGRRGRRGSSGDDGADGKDGADGGVGQNGADGKNGGNGEDGSNGSTGRNGGAGQPGDPGPDLRVVVKPIFSKFYPDERLVYVAVTSVYRHRSSRNPYATRRTNYIFHARERFEISTLGGVGGRGGSGGRGGGGGPGGDGGDGGDGGNGGDGASRGSGRGGKGGNGGAGGDGGDGGDGGRSGSGGKGGKGGDGGNGGQITAQVVGDPTFQRAARRLIVFSSRGGLGGAGGQGGRAGDRGRGGDGGSGGKGGRGGKGGNGPAGPGADGTPGKPGQSGSDGASGDTGRRGQSGRAGRSGRPGNRPW